MTIAVLTDADKAALAVIEQYSDNGCSCTMLGEALWQEHRKRQCYARPAGKVIKRLIAAGYVRPLAHRASDGRLRGTWYKATGKEG